MTATVGRPTPGLGSLNRNPAAPWRHLDLVLVGAVMAIATIGTLMVFSATRGSDPDSRDTYYVLRQLIFHASGVGVLALTTLIDYRRFRDWALAAYLGVVVLLALVVSPVGTESKGTQAWFQLGGFQLQPSELAKVIVIVTLAAILANFQGEVDGRRLSLTLVVIGAPMVMIMVQPDLGTTLVFVAIGMGMLLIGGTRAKHLVALSIFGVVGVVGVLNSDVLEQYQRCRLTSFLERQSETCQARDSSYNLDQSKIAIGSGGTFGKGLFQGTQTRLDIVPEQHTDFIFTAVGEELGFAGAGTLLALFGIVGWRIWRTAQLARDQLGTFICVGVLAMLVFQVFQNVGMTMGIMPITGIPLPFVSYGGSSTIAAYAAIGLVLNVHMRRFA